MVIRSALHGFFILLLVGCGQDSQTSSTGTYAVTPATPCQLIDQPERFNNHKISIAATVQSDGLENAFILVMSCNRSDRVRLGTALEGMTDNQETELFNAINSSYTKSKKAKMLGVRADLVGLFIWNKSSLFPFEVRPLSAKNIKIVPLETTR